MGVKVGEFLKELKVGIKFKREVKIEKSLKGIRGRKKFK